MAAKSITFDVSHFSMPEIEVVSEQEEKSLLKEVQRLVSIFPRSNVVQPLNWLNHQAILFGRMASTTVTALTEFAIGYHGQSSCGQSPEYTSVSIPVYTSVTRRLLNILPTAGTPRRL